MKRLINKLSRSASSSPIRNKRPLAIELLESRQLLAVTVSISDASATEDSTAMKFYDAFVPTGTGGLDGARDLVFHGPYLYAISAINNSILRYDAYSGAFESQFVSPGNGGGLNYPQGIAFDSGGYLYVASQNTDEILRYDTNGAPDTTPFVSTGKGGLDSPMGIAFGPDGNLYVASLASRQILRYQGPGGTNPGGFIDVYAVRVGTEPGPGHVGFGPDGKLYVSGGTTIYRATGVSGAPMETYVAVRDGGLTTSRDLRFDAAGNLLVANESTSQILRYQGPNTLNPGAFVDAFIPSGLGGLVRPIGMTLDLDGNILVSSYTNDQVLRFGRSSRATFSVNLDFQSPVTVTLNYSTTVGTADGSDFVAVPITALGTLTFAPGQVSRTIIVPTLNDSISEPTETFTVVLSNAIGVTIADGVGIGSILDNDPFTKFYVVNDASTDRTYEYGATGTSVENYVLRGGNTAPRGAASTTLGTTVWVVDANKSVYAYDTNGALQGSWTAGGLQATAQLEGIATNGTDVWLVDSNTDKVYRYTNAASRTSDSQNSASSFSLNSGNTNPKDIVTDGNYLWVVDDGSTDKVFKYTIAGTYVGSWRISTSGAKSPTGITLDPSNPAHIWIVDSGTDRVYQYDNSVGLTSGSKSANSSWALAAGNSNPQGIADPPPPSSHLNTAPTSVVVNSAFSSSFLQAPIVSLGAPATERVAQTQSVLSVTESVDKFMSQLTSQLPAAPISVSKPQSTPLQSRTRFAENQSIDLELADDELNDSLHAIANDLLATTHR